MVTIPTVERSPALVDDDSYFDFDTGTEEEREDPAAITEPFNPSLIKISSENVPVASLVERRRENALDLAPDFQRHSGIWNDARKSLLIESLLLRIPIPVFYVAVRRSDEWSVVDGVQRLTTILDFIDGKFKLTKLEYLDYLNGQFHDDLEARFRRRIRETNLSIHLIEHGTPEEVMFNVFLRINTGGVPLSAQEIRHAITPGIARGYLKVLAESKAFVRATGGSVKPMRMADRELVLRFIAFYTIDWQRYRSVSLEKHLSDTMNAISMEDPPFNLHNVGTSFISSMDANYSIFGRDAFRKPKTSRRTRPINKALFETWSTELARCSAADIQTLKRRRNEVRRAYRNVITEDPEFEKAISYSTATQARVTKRFATVADIIRRFTG